MLYLFWFSVGAIFGWWCGKTFWSDVSDIGQMILNDTHDDDYDDDDYDEPEPKPKPKRKTKRKSVSRPGYASAPVGRGKAGKDGVRCSPHQWDMTRIVNGCLVCTRCGRHLDLAHSGNKGKVNAIAERMHKKQGGEAADNLWFLADQSRKGDPNYSDND